MLNYYSEQPIFSYIFGSWSKIDQLKFILYSTAQLTGPAVQGQIF